MVTMQKLEVNFEPSLDETRKDVLEAFIIAFAEECGSRAEPIIWGVEEVCDGQEPQQLPKAE